MLRLIRLSIAVLLLILIAGCGEDSSDKDIKDIIVGRWKLLTRENLELSVIYEFKANGQLFTSVVDAKGRLQYSKLESKYYIVDENTIIILGKLRGPREPYELEVDLTLSFKYVEEHDTIILALVENVNINFILERVK